MLRLEKDDGALFCGVYNAELWFDTCKNMSRFGEDDDALICGVYHVNFAKCSWCDTCKTCCDLGKKIMP